MPWNKFFQRLHAPEAQAQFLQHTDVKVLLQSKDYNRRSLSLDELQRQEVEVLVRQHDKVVAEAYRFEAIETRLALVDAIRRGEGAISAESKHNIRADLQGSLYSATLPGPTQGTRRFVVLSAAENPGLVHARAKVTRVNSARDAAIKGFFARITAR